MATSHAACHLNGLGAVQDLDIDFQLVLNAATYDQLMGQLGRDCALLESLRVMDYSLLLGMHYLSWGGDEWFPPQIKVGQMLCPAVATLSSAASRLHVCMYKSPRLVGDSNLCQLALQSL